MDELHLGSVSGERFTMPADALTHHAVCLGATGSGKTALCIGLLEEVALRGIPVLALDPKGDVANLLLTFAGPAPEALAPWLDERRLREAGGDREAAARSEATRWREGLAASGVEPERVERLRECVELGLYTPGSDAGQPLSLLGDLGPRPGASPEAQRERAHTTAAALLALAGVEAQAGRSREHVLLSALLQHAWGEGQTLELAALVAAVQRPPFSTLGVLDVESYYPAAERFELVLALNHLLSAPGPLLAGAPLSIEALLWSPSGRPRVSVLSVAHLAEHERRAFVTSLLGHLVGWLRTQRGQGGLRALLFMDEVAGYLPPVANPPTKGPFLTLFKQARSQGLGVVVATQNPADIDYKALSNAGTWLVGRLATARDRQRVRDALASSDVGGLDGDAVEGQLAGLRPRQFFCHSTWTDPRVLEARWTMSYLRGPLTLDELRRLGEGAAPGLPSPVAASTAAPLLPPGLGQLFARAEGDGGGYRAWALGVARVGFVDRALGLDEEREVQLAAPLPRAPLGVDWAASQRLDGVALDEAPRPGASFEPLPAGALPAGAPRDWQRALQAHLAQHEERRGWRCAAARQTSAPGESEAAFRGRLGPALAQATEDELASLRLAWAPRRRAAEERVRRAEQAVERRKEQASKAKTDALLTAGVALLGGLLGGARGAGRKVTRVVKDATKVKHTGNERERAAADLDEARKALAKLGEEQAQAEAELREALRPGQVTLEEFTARPARSRVEVVFVGLGWLPTDGGLQARAPGRRRCARVRPLSCSVRSP